jgi:hypothetical protein
VLFYFAKFPNHHSHPNLLEHGGSSTLITSYNADSPLKYFTRQIFSGNEPDVAREVYNI